MSAIQLVSARIDRVTGCGLGVNIGEIWPKPLVTGLMLLLFVANTINIGANWRRWALLSNSPPAFQACQLPSSSLSCR
ncbi:divalent metal cation transporter [Agrobacterium vitis]|uniref:divalent metal cation transporter n=1 Tax=Agrobacterium vitis TaxID=373 RepID=UPI000ABB7F2B|nr:divalent metal cation transporter [Agrobacterium vitis]